MPATDASVETHRSSVMLASTNSITRFNRNLGILEDVFSSSEKGCILGFDSPEDRVLSPFHRQNGAAAIWNSFWFRETAPERCFVSGHTFAFDISSFFIFAQLDIETTANPAIYGCSINVGTPLGKFN